MAKFWGAPARRCTRPEPGFRRSDADPGGGVLGAVAGDPFMTPCALDPGAVEGIETVAETSGGIFR